MRLFCARRLVAALWIACVLALSSAFSQVSAQMREDHMEMTTPDWSSGRAIFAIVYAAVFIPAFTVTLILLWRRRKSYPIAGRGAWFIIAFNVNTLYGTPACLFAWLYFP